MNQKGFVSIIIILIVVALAGGTYFAWQKNKLSWAPNPTQEANDVVGTTDDIVQPENPESAGLAPYPDLPATSDFSQPVSVKFAVEHRSALNGETISVRGIVVSTLLGEKACPPGRGACAQPSIFLADTTDGNRNNLYDLRVIVGEDEQEKNYPIGKTLELQVSIEGNSISIVARKVY